MIGEISYEITELKVETDFSTTFIGMRVYRFNFDITHMLRR